ncbi:hypothetical protein MCOR25_002875 [Pyricularia grisea]|uniref:Uncharacterized protein n=1 Tax=Pyricularia grisea TaxID=148305 RepID=A0A6P8BJ86_PYRGI|nr:uncharacterized protein PgNI_01191 [Pyricularia grisea]KAI6376060.1 hypothetical protein MCOR25_002875 [Pyricularia grisea]TLD16853.1 hypothetical protein PgNI_01191 [Pyricularia grisea]
MAAIGNKIVLITGANQGVGYETAKNLILSSADYHVIIGSRDSTKGEAAVRELLSTAGVKGTAEAVQLDVTDQASIERAMSSIESQHGRLDCLVNNAGVISMANPPTTAAFRNVLETNVVGALGVTEASLHLLKKGGGGGDDGKGPARLVFVTSSMGSITHASNPDSPYYSPVGTEYKVSKAALNMLMAMYGARLRADVGDRVLVFGADPGLCATNLTRDADSLRKRGAAEPSDGGERIAVVVRGEKDADAGKVLGVYGVSPW